MYFQKFSSLLYFITFFFHIKSTISSHQHGFFKGRSTVTNLCSFTQYINDTFEKRSQVDTVYTDFSKAFDKVNHAILLEKMNGMGFSDRLIQLLHSYLVNRNQYVECHGYRSECFTPTSGVPQGSNLGPLLFLIFINDIKNHIQYSKFLMFADDFKLFLEISSNSDCQKLQQDINSIYDWSLKNKLPFNINKCLVLSYTRKTELLKFDYIMGKTTLDRKTETKDLGIIFDDKLNFNNHIEKLNQSCFKTLGFVFRITRDFQGTESIMKIYNALIRTKLEYASVIWNPYYLYQKLSVEKVQKRCLRYCYFKQTGYGFRGEYSDLLQNFNTELLEKRRMMQQFVFLFKIINGVIDDLNLLNRINFYIPQVGLRRPPTFKSEIVKTNYSKNSPIIRLCCAFNYLQIDIFGISLNNFKASLRTRI